jgi:serine carboxypeptidase-like clade 2
MLNADQVLSLRQLAGYDPCIGYYVSDYFNNPEVQMAIHARTNTKWFECK